MTGRRIGEITDLRGTAYLRRGMPAGWVEIDSSELDTPGALGAADRSLCQRSSSASCALQPLGDAAQPPGGARAGGEGREVLPQGAERTARAQRYSHAVLRTGQPGSGAVCACLAHLAHGVESGKCAGAGAAARHAGAVAESAAHSPEHGGHGCDLRIALRTAPASLLRRCEDSGLSHDSIFRGHPARLFRRLHVLFDHRT